LMHLYVSISKKNPFFVPDLSQKAGASRRTAQKDLVLTNQAGVREQTRSVVLLLAAAGAVLERLAIVLELCPARPVGAITRHPSFTHVVTEGVWPGSGTFSPRLDVDPSPAMPIYPPPLLHQLPPPFTDFSSTSAAPLQSPPGDSHPSFPRLAQLFLWSRVLEGCQSVETQRGAKEALAPLSKKRGRCLSGPAAGRLDKCGCSRSI